MRNHPLSPGSGCLRCELLWSLVKTTTFNQYPFEFPGLILIILFLYTNNQFSYVGYLCNSSVKVGNWTDICISSSLNLLYSQTIHYLKNKGQGCEGWHPNCPWSDQSSICSNSYQVYCLSKWQYNLPNSLWC